MAALYWVWLASLKDRNEITHRRRLQLIACLYSLPFRNLDFHIGLERLSVIHANDSKVPFDSGVDRHENIGEGHIGIEGFKTILNHPSLKNVPFILEVPGFDGKGPDKRNIDILNGLISDE